MGQAETKARMARNPPPTPICNSGRQDYLSRLGIQKKGSSFHVPSTRHEASELLESKPKFASFAGPELNSYARIANRSFSQEAPARLETTGPSAPSSRSGSTISTASGADSTLSCETVESEDSVEAPKQDFIVPPNDFRLSFLRKLSYEKVWVPAAQRLPKHQTVTIFDWDDTLLCTSYLNRHDGMVIPPATKKSLALIEKATIRLLEQARLRGHTFIITNAMEGWVEYSAARWIPGVLPMLEKIRIISARSRYEVLYPNDVSAWKIHAFVDLQRELNLPVVTNLTSLGDSNYEMDATLVMGEEFEEAFVKTIKFQEHPSPEELLKELELVEQKFESVVGNARNLRVSLERKHAAPCA